VGGALSQIRQIDLSLKRGLPRDRSETAQVEGRSSDSLLEPHFLTTSSLAGTAMLLRGDKADSHKTLGWSSVLLSFPKRSHSF